MNQKVVHPKNITTAKIILASIISQLIIIVPKDKRRVNVNIK